MAAQMDLIKEAIAAGRMTKCPPKAAAGHKRAKLRKGERVRPCPRCERPIKFIKGAWNAYGQRRRGWHWVNESGGHHRCSDFMQFEPRRYWDRQWREAMERDVEHGKPGHSALQRDLGPEGSQTPEDDEKRVHESTACEEAA